ncbi:MAG: hypothetical protein KGI70_00500 [Patescibacteria group bacterium]|nr:hypothetical protein [Patescibacteria group bacterium]
MPIAPDYGELQRIFREEDPAILERIKNNPEASGFEPHACPGCGQHALKLIRNNTHEFLKCSWCGHSPVEDEEQSSPALAAFPPAPVTRGGHFLFYRV